MSLFSTNRATRRKRSKFNLSHERKLSMNMGELIPTLVQEVVPGDNFKVSQEQMIRLAPMIAPIMHRINVYTHYFFVPNRIVWDNWEDFITGGPQGDLAPSVPVLTYWNSSKTRFPKGGLADHLGIPPIDEITSGASSINISEIPFRAYQEIYNEYYRDQNLTNPIAYNKGDGGGTSEQADAVTTLRKRAWAKDYFTSALPWSQRGGEANIPVDYMDQSRWYSEAGDSPTVGGPLETNTSSQISATVDSVITPGRIENIEGITVNDLRRSVRLQEWLEKTARGGSRYIEQILSHFGVKSSDARLQRPEYLGGGKNPVVISEVLNTAGDFDNQSSAAVGEMAGHGVSVGANFGFKRSFEEHGYVLGITSVIPRATYQQGINRHFSRKDKFDYYWPEFANLGEQEIKNQEIYADVVTADAPNENTFGYQSRYSEYKYGCNTVHGDFRDELDFWHMGRKFANLPALNETFVMADPTDRIFAVTDASEEKLYVQIYNSISALRPMPYFGTPRL